MKKQQQWQRRLDRIVRDHRYSPEFVAWCLRIPLGKFRQLLRGKARFTAALIRGIRILERRLDDTPFPMRWNRRDAPPVPPARTSPFSHENYLDLLYRVVRARRGKYRDGVVEEDDDAPRRHYWRDRMRPHALPALQSERTLRRWRTRHGEEIERFPHETAFERWKLSEDERWILIALMAQDKEMYEERGTLTAEKLLRTVAPDRRALLAKRNLLVEDAPLRKMNLIRPGKGECSFFSFLGGEDTSLLGESFELTRGARERLFGPLLAKAIRHKEKSEYARIEHPRYGLDGVVLPEGHRQRLEEVLAQARDGGALFDRWGLGKTIHYGKGTLLLFQGPPGTGKTLTAGALAHALDRPLLAADFGKLESCWVGETEKNTIALFQEAKEKNAVLFIDEADGLLATREMATRSWEIRHVNVLLQELERFDGVAVLATNNAGVLDPALESRCSLRLRFPMPGPAERERIFRAHLPPETPLAEDVNLAALAERWPLSGRAVKNVILAAARKALAAGREKVAMSDLVAAGEEAVATDEDAVPIGFRGGAS